MRKFFQSIMICSAVTPLVFLIIGDPTNLPKFVWIFLLTALLFMLGIKNKLFDYRNTFILPVGLYFSWSLLTLIKCTNIFTGLYSIIILLLFITFYISLENSAVRDNALINAFIKGTVLVSVVVSVYGLLQLAGIDFIVWTVKRSAASTLGRRNFAAEYLVMVIPYVYYLISRDRKKWFLYIPLVLLILHLVFTFTRASYMAFFISSVIFLILTGRKILINRKVVILLCIVLFARIAFSGISTFEKGTVKSRMYIWNIALKMIKENPVMGVGTGNFIIMYPYYGIGEEKTLKGASLVVDRAHNDFLDICSETGVPGLLLFLYLLISFFRVSFITYRKCEREDKLLIAAIVSSVSGICINALASFPFHNPATLLLFWANLSFAGGLYRKLRGEIKIKISYPLLKLYLGVFVITGIVMSSSVIKSSRYLFLAKKTDGKNSLYFAEKSASYNPYSFTTLQFAGTSAMNMGDYRKADIFLTRGIKLSPYYDSLHNNLGLTSFFTGDLKKAEDSFLNALKLNPESYEFNNNIGFLYLATERYDEAIKSLQKAVRLKSNAYISFFSLGAAYYQKGQYKDAKAQFLKVLEIKPDFEPAEEYLEKLSSY